MDTKSTYTITTTDVDNAIDLIHILEAYENDSIDIGKHYRVFMNVLELFYNAIKVEDISVRPTLNNFQIGALIELIELIYKELRRPKNNLAKQ